MSNILYEAWASAVVDANGDANVRGCSVGRDAEMVYTVILDRELHEADCSVHITIRGNDGASSKKGMVNHLDNSLKEVRFFYDSGGDAQATAFHISFFKFANYGGEASEELHPK